MPTASPPSARRHYLWSSLLATRAVREARNVRGRGVPAVATVVATHQITAATRAQTAVTAMLAEQSIEATAEALLNSTVFTSTLDQIEVMLDQVEVDWQFNRLVASLVQDAGRAAESVTVAATPNIGYVRYLNPPSCSRCAVLAGRVYRYSTGFLRHPGCGCGLIPTTLANPGLVQDPVDLMERGLVTGLSKADQQAIRDGADFGRVVNVRSSRAGMSESGRVLARRGRPTPEAIYRANPSREEALAALQRAGYLR